MQQDSWKVMKIYSLKIFEIRYWSFFVSVALRVSSACFVKQAPGRFRIRCARKNVIII